MGAKLINLFVIIAAAVMVADMIAKPAGTNALFNGFGNIWKTSVNGMLGKTG